MREALVRRTLLCYAKTTGTSGLRAYAPLAPGHTFEGVRAWVRRVADELAAEHPALVAAPRGGATDQGSRVTVDEAQNSIAHNTAAPYTLRARPDVPTASTPLTLE